MVYSSSGVLIVNQFIGSKSVESYVLKSGERYVLENEAATKLIPVE